MLTIAKEKMIEGGKSVLDKDNHGVVYKDYFYLFGLLCADGSINKVAKNCLLELKDEQILSDIKKTLGFEYRLRNGRTQFRMCIPVNLTEKYINMGLKIRKGKEGFKLAKMNKSSFGHFLRGFFDGDGCVDKHNGRVRVRFSGNPKSLCDIQKTLLDEFEIYAPFYPSKKKKWNGNLEINKTKSCEKLFDVMYKNANLFLERKHSAYTKLVNGGS